MVSPLNNSLERCGGELLVAVSGDELMPFFAWPGGVPPVFFAWPGGTPPLFFARPGGVPLFPLSRPVPLA